LKRLKDVILAGFPFKKYLVEIVETKKRFIKLSKKLNDHHKLCNLEKQAEFSFNLLFYLNLDLYEFYYSPNTDIIISVYLTNDTGLENNRIFSICCFKFFAYFVTNRIYLNMCMIIIPGLCGTCIIYFKRFGGFLRKTNSL